MNIFQLTKKIVNSNKDQIYNIFSSEAMLRVIAWYVTPIFYYLRLSPNSISVIALLTGLYGSLLIFQNGIDYIGYGVIFFILSVIIDHCDGNIARLKNIPTFFGRFMDCLFDIIVIGVFQCSLFYVFVFDNNSNLSFLTINNNVLSIMIIISIFSTPIQHLIYDRYSAYTRWIKEDHSLNIQPTLRREISFVYIDIINDIQLILLILMPFYFDLMIIYFAINLLASFYITLLHLYFSKKYMSTFAENHRQKDIKRQ